MFRHHNTLRQGAAPQIEEVGIDGIPRPKPRHPAADLHHHTGQIAAEHGGQLELEQGFEGALRDHVVDGIETDGMHLDQDLIRPHGRVRQFSKLGPRRATIAFEHKGFHHLATGKHDAAEPGKAPVQSRAPAQIRRASSNGKGRRPE
ncbi:hypothetical protein D3C79_677330 [compost metagenome]